MMPATQGPEKPAGSAGKGRQDLEALVGERVLLTLGRPPGMLRLQVRCLWSDCYRVNVFVGNDVSCATIARSFFVRADTDGSILQATPPLSRQYGA